MFYKGLILISLLVWASIAFAQRDGVVLKVVPDGFQVLQEYVVTLGGADIQVDYYLPKEKIIVLVERNPSNNASQKVAFHGLMKSLQHAGYKVIALRFAPYRPAYVGCPDEGYPSDHVIFNETPE